MVLIVAERVMLLVRVGVAAGVRELDADLLPVTLRVADTVAVALDVALGDIVGEAVSLDDREGESEEDLDAEGDLDGVFAALLLIVWLRDMLRLCDPLTEVLIEFVGLYEVDADEVGV